MPRDCVSYCGMGDKYCCTAGQVCYTDAANIAICGAQTAFAGNNGGWNYYTTTIIENIEVPTTRTETLSEWVGEAAASTTAGYLAQSTATCYAPLKSCGSICCASNQECYVSGQCRALDSNSQTLGGSYSTNAPAPTGYSAPVRPTSAVTTTVPITTTQAFVAPVQTGDREPLTEGASKGGLSGGAIAGIVIGVIAGVSILLFILACCCLGAGLKGVFALLFGKKDNKKGSRTEITETRRTHSTRYGGSAAASRREHSGWFGGARGGNGSTRTSRVDEKRHSKGKEAAGLAGLAVGLAGLWGALKYKRNKEEEKKPQTYSYYSYTDDSYTTTDSE